MLKALDEFRMFLARNNIDPNKFVVEITARDMESLLRLDEACAKNHNIRVIEPCGTPMAAYKVVGMTLSIKLDDRRKADRRKKKYSSLGVENA